MPDSDPTNSTTAPCFFKSAATHSAGIACPPVPPPAISIRGFWWLDLSGSFTVLRYPVEDAHGGEAYQQTRTTIAHEGERHPRERENHHGGPDVEDGLDGQHRCEACSHATRHDRGGVHCYPQSGQRDKTESGDHGDHADQAKLFPYQGEDHIRTELGDIRPLPARPGPRAEEAAGFYGYHGLNYLVARTVRCGPGIEERKEPLATIRLENHHPRHRHRSRQARKHEVPGPEFRGPQRACRAREQDHGGAEIRFDKDQAEEHPYCSDGLEGQSRTRRHTCDRAAQGQYGSELRELSRLDTHRAKIEPPPGAVYLGSDLWHEHEHEADQHDQVQGRSVFAPRGIPDPAGHEEGGHPEDHMPDADEKNTGPDLPVRRRIDHDEPQQGEAERHQEQV